MVCPCQRELPAFEQFQATQPPDGAAILAVNVQESGDQITSFLNEHDIQGLNVLLDPDGKRPNARDFQPACDVRDRSAGDCALSEVRRDDSRRPAYVPDVVDAGVGRRLPVNAKKRVAGGVDNQAYNKAKVLPVHIARDRPAVEECPVMNIGRAFSYGFDDPERLNKDRHHRADRDRGPCTNCLRRC